MIVTTGGRGVVSTADSSPLAGGCPIRFPWPPALRSVMTLRLRAEEARHLGRQFGIERLVDGGEDAAAEQARDEILGANVQLLG
jgi:hypothetical protein